MTTIRDNTGNPLVMIPAFIQYGINRCNIKDCKEKHTTICIHSQATFGLCENHYQKFKEIGEVKLNLEF